MVLPADTISSHPLQLSRLQSPKQSSAIEPGTSPGGQEIWEYSSLSSDLPSPSLSGTPTLTPAYLYRKMGSKYRTCLEVGCLIDLLPESCSLGNPKTSVPQWVFYLLAMLFDFVVVLLSSFLLSKPAGGIIGCVPTYLTHDTNSAHRSRRMSSILKM